MADNQIHGKRFRQEECILFGWDLTCQHYECPNVSSHRTQFVSWIPSAKTTLTDGFICDFVCLRCPDKESWTACVVCGDDNGRKIIKSRQAVRRHEKSERHVSKVTEARLTMGAVAKKQRLSAPINSDGRSDTTVPNPDTTGPNPHAESSATHGQTEILDSASHHPLSICQEIRTSVNPIDTAKLAENGVELHDVKFGREESEKFFTYEARGEGLKYLVVQSLTGNHHMTDKVECDQEDIDLSVSLSRLIMDLSQHQQKLLADVLRLHEIQVKKNLTRKRRGTVCPTTPTGYKEIRTQYSEGKTSILKQIPHPRWQMCSKGLVAYASIIDTIQDFFAHGFVVDQVRQADFPGIVRTPGESRFAQEILQRSKSMYAGHDPDYVIYLILWEDDYENNNGKVQTDHTAYKKNLTISPAPHARHPRAYTYPLVLGRKKSDDEYERVQNFHNTELALLSGGRLNRFYCANKGGRATVHAEVLAVMGDQPARRKSHHLMNGNANLHGRFGFRLDHWSIWNSFVSCDDCQKSLKEGPVLPHTCLNCHSWDAARVAEKIDFQKLTEECCQVRDQLVNRQISDAEAIKLLHGLCVDSSAQKKHLAIAHNRRTMEEANNASELPTEVREDYCTHPERYDVSYSPPAWRVPGVTIDHCVEAIMHILFLGVVKDVLLLTHDWLTCSSLSKEGFLRLVGGAKVVETVESLSISWCRARGYGDTGKFGGKVSEHYLADARLLPWIMLWLQKTSVKPPYVEPTKPLNSWTKAELERWLSVRGLPTDGYSGQNTNEKTNIQIKRESVRDFKAQAFGPPPLSDKNGGPMANLHNVYMSLYALLPRVMCEYVSEHVIKEVDRHYRIFLDSYSVVDDRIKNGASPCQTKPGVPPPADVGKKKRAGSSLKANHLCLANIPAMMKNFGPVRNFWDGDTKAEASLQDTKQLQTGRGVDPEHVMPKEQTYGGFRRMEYASERKTNQQMSRWKNRSLYEYKLYRNDDYASSWPSEVSISPVSCVFYYSDKTFWVQLKNGMEVQIVCERFEAQFIGMDYFLFSIRTDAGRNGVSSYYRPSVTQKSEACSKQNVEFCILLPLPYQFVRDLPGSRIPSVNAAGDQSLDQQDPTYRRIYTVIGHRWTVLSSASGNMGWFRIPGYKYDENGCEAIPDL